MSTNVNWFVGASYGGTKDQTERFLSEEIWENGNDDKYLDLVRSMQPGDRIAIKSSYVRSKTGLPFDNQGQPVSVMAIKAVGTIRENPKDGRHVKVDWTKIEPVREWYFYTNRNTVWPVQASDWMAEGLIAFAFDNAPQDIERFRNAPDRRERFGTEAPDGHDLSQAACQDTELKEGDMAALDNAHGAAPFVPYSVDDILKDGCFLDRRELDRLLDRLGNKKNLILQGPPGTGKTWLARRLAFALMGQKDESKVRAVQFHPNLSYEDFVRGWRPTGEGKLSLVDGVFMEAIKSASKDPASKFVVVIEEINRGNPAQIFGELLTLLEAGKRKPSEALELCFPDADGTRRPVHIPDNLYVVGTMNIADRSLALVDLALRRRFAFVGLEPRLGPVWRNWVITVCDVDQALAEDIEHRVAALNDKIAADARLGTQFRIGHSYVTPSHRLEAGGTKEWFQQVVETEIGPLLDEYWFDAPDEAQTAVALLTQGW